jgi:hypothetical protein
MHLIDRTIIFAVIKWLRRAGLDEKSQTYSTVHSASASAKNMCTQNVYSAFALSLHVEREE